MAEANQDQGPAASASVWNRSVLSWSLYDFANTIYSMNIVSLYLKRYIVEDLKFDDRYFDIPFSISMLLAAILLPGLGTISDYSTKKKIFVFLFTLTCCMAVGLMALVPSSVVLATIILFIVANFSYEAAQPFYNSLLYSVADGSRARFVSGLGVSLGYVGSIVGMLIVQPFVTGSVLSFDISFIQGSGKVASFAPTAILFFLFSVPLFLWVREKPMIRPGKVTLRESYSEVWSALRQTRKFPGVLRFLISDYFFEDAAMTVILNIGLYCSIVIGMADNQITTFLVISTVTAVIGAFMLGKIAEYVSLRNLLRTIVVGWVVSLLLFILYDKPWMVWLLGSVIGILLGGLWTTTRPMLAEMVPREDLGRFFGIFSLSGRAAAVVGPLVWTSVVYFFSPERFLGRAMIDLFSIPPDNYAKLPYKMGVLSLMMLMMIGLFVYRKVPHTRRRVDA